MLIFIDRDERPAKVPFSGAYISFARGPCAHVGEGSTVGIGLAPMARSRFRRGHIGLAAIAALPWRSAFPRNKTGAGATARRLRRVPGDFAVYAYHDIFSIIFSSGFTFYDSLGRRAYAPSASISAGEMPGLLGANIGRGHGARRRPYRPPARRGG